MSCKLSLSMHFLAQILTLISIPLLFPFVWMYSVFQQSREVTCSICRYMYIICLTNIPHLEQWDNSVRLTVIIHCNGSNTWWSFFSHQHMVTLRQKRQWGVHINTSLVPSYPHPWQRILCGLCTLQFYWYSHNLDKKGTYMLTVTRKLQQPNCHQYIEFWNFSKRESGFMYKQAQVPCLFASLKKECHLLADTYFGGQRTLLTTCLNNIWLHKSWNKH